MSTLKYFLMAACAVAILHAIVFNLLSIAAVMALSGIAVLFLNMAKNIFTSTQPVFTSVIKTLKELVSSSNDERQQTRANWDNIENEKKIAGLICLGLAAGSVAVAANISLLVAALCILLYNSLHNRDHGTSAATAMVQNCQKTLEALSDILGYLIEENFDLPDVFSKVWTQLAKKHLNVDTLPENGSASSEASVGSR